LGQIEFFDANCRIARDNNAPANAPTDVEILLAEMDRIGIAGALAHASLSWLSTTPSRSSRLHFSCVLAPGEAASDALGWGAEAVRLLPNRYRYRFTLSDCGSLLSALQNARIPVFVDYESGHWTQPPANYDHIGEVCAAYPELPVVLCGAGIGEDKYLYGLFEKFSNFRIELSYYQVEGGIEAVCSRFGAARLLFGTGLPDFSPGSAMSYVSYARITERERRLIAADNLRALLPGALE
jgi:hypothetical protein